MSLSRWPAEAELNGFFGGSLSLNVSPLPFKILSFKNFLLIYVFLVSFCSTGPLCIDYNFLSSMLWDY